MILFCQSAIERNARDAWNGKDGKQKSTVLRNSRHAEYKWEISTNELEVMTRSKVSSESGRICERARYWSAK